MSLTFRTPELAEVAGRLGLTEEAIVACTHAPSLAEARAKLEAYKGEVKARWRKLAISLHPDRNPAGEAEFKKLAAGWTEIEKFLASMEIRDRPPAPPPVQIIVMGFGGGGFNPFSTGGTGTTGTTAGFYGPWTSVF